MEKNNIKKINVGCGPDKREGWINIDMQQFKSVDVVMDVTKEWKFEDVDLVYAEHFIEHLKIEDGMRFLVNAGKSLKRGGHIRLATPNVEWVLKTHYKPEFVSDEELFDGVTSINRAFYGWGHRFLYSPFILKEILQKIGYADVELKEFGKSDIREFNDIEKHGKLSCYDGSPNVIVIEGRKDGDVSFPQGMHDALFEKFIKYSNAIG